MLQLTSREFNQFRGRALRRLDQTPVLVTKRGKPAFVIQSFASWQQMQTAAQQTAQTNKEAE